MVDYWETDIFNNPQCPHGPTLLFSRKRNDRKFYSCAAFRDRKQCSFFLWQDDSDGKEVSRDDSFNQLVSKFKSQRKRVQRSSSTSVKKSYCCTCDLLIRASKCSRHTGHDIQEIVNDTIIRYPTMLMKPKQQSKGESQFHFSEPTIHLINSFLIQLNVSSVMCIGCPTVHEYISNNETCQLESLLLDIDPRFLQFYEPDQFQLFNMYNCHMFDSDGWKELERLSSLGKTCIVIDPPFGGRVEVLAYTLNRLQTITNKDFIVLLVLPYFMEPAVKQSLPTFSMLDYRVEYGNHRQFKTRIGSSDRGSAVRIFTNANPSLFVLPEEEGYKYCDLCERWVYSENRHCFTCEACTSKNGAPYRHCNRCGKCVKQTWKHCFECGICKLPTHLCKKENSEAALKSDKPKNKYCICKKRKWLHNKRENGKKVRH